MIKQLFLFFQTLLTFILRVFNKIWVYLTILLSLLVLKSSNFVYGIRIIFNAEVFFLFRVDVQKLRLTKNTLKNLKTLFNGTRIWRVFWLTDKSPLIFYFLKKLIKYLSFQSYFYSIYFPNKYLPKYFK